MFQASILKKFCRQRFFFLIYIEKTSLANVRFWVSVLWIKERWLRARLIISQQCSTIIQGGKSITQRSPETSLHFKQGAWLTGGTALTTLSLSIFLNKKYVKAVEDNKAVTSNPSELSKAHTSGTSSQWSLKNPINDNTIPYLQVESV